MSRPIACVALLLLVLAGCQKKEEPAAAAASASTATPALPAPAGTDIPTSEDYEQPALDEINPQNMESEIDKLEKEIGK